MTPARWTFLVIFGLGLLMGLAIGTINLVNPDAANITFNDQKVTGMAGFFTALLSAGIPALIIGLLVAGVVVLFTRRKKSAA